MYKTIIIAILAYLTLADPDRPLFPKVALI